MSHSVLVYGSIISVGAHVTRHSQLQHLFHVFWYTYDRNKYVINLQMYAISAIYLAGIYGNVFLYMSIYQVSGVNCEIMSTVHILCM